MSWPYSPCDTFFSDKAKIFRETMGSLVVVDFFGIGYLIGIEKK